MLALIGDGDEVLLPAPGYSAYNNAICFFGGRPVPIPTREHHNFAIVPADVEARVTERTNTPAQFAALAALTGSQDVVRDMREAYRQRLNYVMAAWDRMGLSYAIPGGGFCFYASVAGIGLSAEAFCERLLREEHVLIYPGSMFGDERDDYVRLSLVQPLDRIKDAVGRIERFVARCRAEESGLR